MHRFTVSVRDGVATMRPDDPFDDAVTARAVIAADGTLVRWSEGARLLLGHTAEEVVGRPAAELLAGVSGPSRPPAARWSGTLALRHRDGGTVTVWVLAHHREPAGDGPGDWLAVTLLDDTGQELPDDPLVRTAVFQSPCATMVFDEKLRLRGVNDAMAHLLGLPAPSCAVCGPRTSAAGRSTPSSSGSCGRRCAPAGRTRCRRV
ncbi:hypothetical protein SHKM778_53250 [Streptomyces sp. KM77-8]|uniref:PAS domain-containing protein n=1 Tax=Streptomyces haneummycinicus TaxID=3074435 RepID=A0AAT9HNL1_9ACTN